MFVNTRFRGFQIILNITKVNQFFYLKFVDGQTNEIHENKCPMKKNIISQYSKQGRW